MVEPYGIDRNRNQEGESKMNDREKYLAAITLFMVWGALAYLGKTPMDPFVLAISSTISGIGVYHTTLVDPKGKP